MTKNCKKYGILWTYFLLNICILIFGFFKRNKRIISEIFNRSNLYNNNNNQLAQGSCNTVNKFFIKAKSEYFFIIMNVILQIS